MPGLSLQQLRLSIHPQLYKSCRVQTGDSTLVTDDWSQWPTTGTIAEPNVVHPREFGIRILVLFCRECTSAENMKNEANTSREAKMRNKEKFIVEFSVGQWGVKEVSAYSISGWSSWTYCLCPRGTMLTKKWDWPFWASCKKCVFLSKVPKMCFK